MMVFMACLKASLAYSSSAFQLTISALVELLLNFLDSIFGVCAVRDHPYQDLLLFALLTQLILLLDDCNVLDNARLRNHAALLNRINDVVFEFQHVKVVMSFIQVICVSVCKEEAEGFRLILGFYEESTLMCSICKLCARSDHHLVHSRSHVDQVGCFEPMRYDYREVHLMEARSSQ